MKWWKYISNVGINQNEFEVDVRRAKLTNRMIFIALCLTIPYYPVFISQGVVIPLIKAALFNALVLSLYLLSARSKHTLAATLLCVLIILHITSDTIMNEGGTGMYYMIPLSIMGFTMIKNKKVSLAIFFLAIIGFFTAHFGQDYIEPIVKSNGKGENVKYIINMSLIFIGTLYFIRQMIGTNEKYEAALMSQKEMIEQQHKELFDTHKNIQDSIVYAKRIQKAIMPPMSAMHQELINCFVLYRPKDVVAGDFYWLEKTQDKLFFAAADCTGHGVPGAMVSVICNNALNRSVREYNIQDPGKILDKTKEIVIQEFQKSEDQVRDGMDIALCSIDGLKLEYAGANNPAWIFRDNELIQLSADRQPIGDFQEAKPYTTQTFELQKNDTLYLFTDGYADQFGGDNGKKFKIKNLMDLLKRIQSLSMDEQSLHLEKTLETWMDGFEQVDDICIIGVKI